MRHLSPELESQLPHELQAVAVFMGSHSPPSSSGRAAASDNGTMTADYNNFSEVRHGQDRQETDNLL